MSNLKDKFLTKMENKGNKKTIENLVIFVIILIATIIFINYIWNDDKKEKSQENYIADSEENIITPTMTNNIANNNSLEKQLEVILKNLEGVEDVQVLITYEETNRVIPMYNEDNQQSVTQEEDNQGRG